MEFVITLTPDDDPSATLEFVWHGALTVNVFACGAEIDVFTFAEQPALDDVKDGCRAYIRDSASA